MLKVSLVTPNKKILLNFPAKGIFIPSFEGEINILPGHAAMMTTLSLGDLRVVSGDDELSKYVITWGYCEVSNDSITILAETAEGVEEIDVERAQDAYKRAQNRLEEAGLSVGDIEVTQRKLERAELRLSIAKNARENN